MSTEYILEVGFNLSSDAIFRFKHNHLYLLNYGLVEEVDGTTRTARWFHISPGDRIKFRMFNLTQDSAKKIVGAPTFFLDFHDPSNTTKRKDPFEVKGEIPLESNKGGFVVRSGNGISSHTFLEGSESWTLQRAGSNEEAVFIFELADAQDPQEFRGFLLSAAMDVLQEGEALPKSYYFDPEGRVGPY